MSSQDSTPSVLSMLFLGQEVRFTVDEHGELCWVAQDVAKILGIENARQNLAKFPDDEKGVCSTYTNRGPRETLTVNEPGLYRLIFQSRKPEAEDMKRWVFHDVLPTLRRFGSYSMPTKGLQNLHTLPPTPMLQDDASRLIPKHTHAGAKSTDDNHFDITANMVRIWIALQQTTDWLSAKEASKRTNTVLCTAGRILRNLHKEGLLDVRRANAFWYRIAENAPQQHPEFYREIKEMQALFQQQGIVFNRQPDWHPNDFR